MKFRDGISRYRPSPKWRSWRPSPSLLFTVASLMVLTGSIAWASDASVRLTATDDATGQQSGINVLYKDTGNGDYAPAMVRADPNVGADAHVRLTGTNAQGQQTGVNVGYHDTGNGDYAPIFQEVNASGTPVSAGGGAAPTATPSCADLGGNCTFTSAVVTGSTTDTSLEVDGVQPTSGNAQPALLVTGANGGNTSAPGDTAGRGGVNSIVAGDGGSASGTNGQGGSGGYSDIYGGQGGNGSGAGSGIGGTGGAVHVIAGGGGVGDTVGGDVVIRSGDGGTTCPGCTDTDGGNAGTVDIRGGVGPSSNGNGGPVTISGGAANQTGGTVSISGGTTNGTGRAAGSVNITGANAIAPGTDSDGGSVTITAGAATGSGAHGDVQIGSTTGGETTLRGSVRLDGCLVSTATPVPGSVLTASSSTDCSFVTPAAGGTAVPTATPQPAVAQSSFCDKGVTAGLTVSYVSVQCASSSATEANVQTAMAQAATIQNLYITTQGAQGGSGNLTVKFRKNGADTAVTVTVTAGAAAGVFSDTTHTFNAAAGDLIDFSQIDSGNATSAQWVASYQIANGVATRTCVLTSATPVAGTFLFAQSSNNCVWSTPTPRATATLVATATPQPTETPQIHAAVSQNTPAAGQILYFPGPQPTPGVYVNPSTVGGNRGFITSYIIGGGECGGGNGGATVPLNSGRYFSVPGGGPYSCNNTLSSSNQKHVIPFATTLSGITVFISSFNQPVSGAMACTLYVDSVASSVVATIPAGAAFGQAFIDTTHSVNAAAGSYYMINCFNHATANNGAGQPSAEIQSLAVAYTTG